MKTTWTKKLTALVCSVMMLCSLCAVGVSADNGLEILEGQDTVYLPLGTEFYSSCSSVPEGVDGSTLIWTIGDETVAKYVEATEYSDGYYQAIAAGETTLSVSTPDGAYTDTIALIVQPAIPMKGDTATVYINSTYTARTFEYTAAQTGYYVLDMYAYELVLLYDADLNMLTYVSKGDETYLEANETYYLIVMGAPYNGMSIAFDLSLTYVGEDIEPNSLVFVEDEITMSLYDKIAFPAYSFEPGGVEYYDSVSVTVEEGSLLTLDYFSNNMYASGVGEATVTVTADNYGWTDTVKVNIVDEKRVLTTDETLTMSLGDTEELAVFFTAPETKSYTFYSVAETEEDDPLCVVYDAETGEEIIYSDDVNGLDFAATVELTEGQTVKLALGGYNSENNFELGVGASVPATGVEVFFHEAVSKQGDTVYVMSGTWLYPNVRFLGGPTALPEEYDIAIETDGTPDEYGEYMLEAGQTATFTVTTESGLTDTVTVVAIDMLLGDIIVDGKVDAADALALFYYINGVSTPDAATLGAMDITGDNKITLDDAVRLFYMASGLI